MPNIRNLVAALTLSGLLAAAPDARTVFAPIPLDPESEALVAVVNTCNGSATYQVIGYDALAGDTILTKQGTLAPRKAATATYDSTANRDALVFVVNTACQSGPARSPLVSLTVRDRNSKVPRYLGTSTEGTGI